MMNQANGDEIWKPWRIALISLLALSLASLMLWAMISFDQQLTLLDNGLILDQAEFLDSDSESPPPNSPSWSYTGIPDDWNHNAHNGNSAWYRFRMTIAAPPTRLWGIYLPVVHQNASVWLNGELLGDGGPFDHPLARNWNRPLYFSIPKGLIEAGENVLMIRIKSTGETEGLLAPVYLAPTDFVYPRYRMKFFFRYTLLQFIIITLGVSALLLYVLTWLRPIDKLYAWYAVALSSFLIYSLKYVVIEPPINEILWDRIVAAGLLWFPTLAASFIQRFIGQVDRHIERFLYRLAIALSLALFTLPDRFFPIPPARIVDSTALLIGLYPVYILLRYLINQPQRDTFLLMTSGFLMIIFGIHDWLITHGWISRLSGQFLPYSTPLGLLLFVYILMRRFVNAMNESEHLNLHLQSEIERKHRELEKSFGKMRELERRNAINEERARLMRDMHDGMGGHLVALLAQVEDRRSSNDQIAKELRSALDDLRLMIDSMEDVNGELLALLAMLRNRLEPRLRSAGIHLQWKVQDIPPFPDLNPEKALHILRILQEAITNVLKHAEAGEIRIGLEERKGSHGQDGILITCDDDGKGFSESRDSTGRGLHNMRRRARFIGAQVGYDRGQSQGTRFWLWLPRTA